MHGGGVSGSDFWNFMHCVFAVGAQVRKTLRRDCAHYVKVLVFTRLLPRLHKIPVFCRRCPKLSLGFLAMYGTIEADIWGPARSMSEAQ
jgi:hypothetical protein